MLNEKKKENKRKNQSGGVVMVESLGEYLGEEFDIWC